MDPKVSICIPAYNHGRFLRAAIESALAQSWADLEVVVSDNCSTDDTAEIVAAVARHDARVRYELAPKHVSMAENFNRCVGLAAGKYIKFLCADDLLEPECTARLIAAIEQDDAVLASCARALVDEGAVATLKVVRFARRDWEGPGTEAARRCFFFGNLIGEPTAVLYRRDVLERFGAHYTQLVDLDQWLRILEHGRFASLAEPLCRIRQHPTQASHESAAAGRITGDKKRLFRDYSQRPHMRGTLLHRLLWDFRMAWSARREPAGHASPALAEGLFYPGLQGAMAAGAALARLLRINA